MAGLYEGGNEPPGSLKASLTISAKVSASAKKVSAFDPAILGAPLKQDCWNKYRIYLVLLMIKTYVYDIVKYELSILMAVPVESRSKASCLGLALRNARWFESSWGNKFSHEISASVWDRCPPSIVRHLGNYDR
ncbi:hypothetical protein ANN_14173 [Periplaneta americana]|uniref:Uncharacterized protein n=1 Tax=Periplaneta americana TaxID=6978 RepID=A0ABQ8SVK6_PERAM|nr:hypothetical protein ANN_14173 [Periplaneta americana]